MEASKKALQVLDNLIIEGNTVRITEQLNRKTYQEVNSILESIEGKYITSVGAHIFPDDVDIEQEINLIIATGEYVDLKKDFQLFATPKAIAETVVTFAHITHDDFVIEPSCGLGAIADIAWEYKPKELWGIELNTQLKKHLDKKPYKTYVGYDWLRVASQPELQNQVDKIVMNPPFSKNADVDHVMAAYNCLKPGGRLVAIMSRHWQFAQEEKCKVFRELMTRDGDLIQQLEPGAFKESGTGIATCIILLDKGANTYFLDWVNEYDSIVHMHESNIQPKTCMGPPDGLTDESFEQVIKEYSLFQLSQTPLPCTVERLAQEANKLKEETIEKIDRQEVKKDIKVEIKNNTRNKQVKNNKVKGYTNVSW